MGITTPVPDPKRGYPIDLDKVRYLRITLGAMRRLEEVSGFKFNSPEFAEWGESLEGICAMVWAGLAHEDPDLTIERARELVEDAVPWQLQEAVKGAVSLAMVRPETTPNGSGDHPLAPTAPNRQARRHPPSGTRSAPSGSSTSG